jgi:hypothetical protein
MDLAEKYRFGAPIYSSAPRMSGNLKYIDDPRLLKFCTEYVQKNGGENFFTNKNWRNHLKKRAVDYFKNRKLQDKFETKIEQKKHIYYELNRSKEILEKYLSGKEIKHLAYPWGIGSELSIELSKKAGYYSNFWGRSGINLKNRCGSDPFRISRIGEDFIFLLPGNGRKSLLNILLKKIKRKMKYESA